MHFVPCSSVVASPMRAMPWCSIYLQHRVWPSLFLSVTFSLLPLVCDSSPSSRGKNKVGAVVGPLPLFRP